ncbi:MAG: radical SAM protein, partial [Clostridium sp.]
VLTGIHLSSYGVDFSDALNFVSLEGKPLLAVISKVAEIEGVERIRLGSLEPRIITESFAKELSAIKKVCPHFHLSLQSGCDTVLKRMNRHYTSAEYKDKVEILRKYFDYPAITTDVITDFGRNRGRIFDYKKFSEGNCFPICTFSLFAAQRNKSCGNDRSG